jgi:hypothetical protein
MSCDMLVASKDSLIGVKFYYYFILKLFYNKYSYFKLPETSLAIIPG